jgi:hypothetical protein
MSCIDGDVSGDEERDEKGERTPVRENSRGDNSDQSK